MYEKNVNRATSENRETNGSRAMNVTNANRGKNAKYANRVARSS